jgi:pterin-4a-carbinolamine dehydratase
MKEDAIRYFEQWKVAGLLNQEEIEKLMAQYRGWELVEDKKLVKEFKFKDFVEAKYFSKAAEEKLAKAGGKAVKVE